MKRICSLLLALVLMIGMLPVCANAATLNNGLVYEVYEDHVEITGYTGDTAELVIPAKIEGKPVTSIGESAFEYNKVLTSVVIPEGVTYIGEGAFADCYNLTDVVIPDSVTVIDDAAFGWCYSLKSIVIPDNVTSISWWTFYDCNSLANVVIGKNVTFIASEAFAFCYELSSLVFRGDAPRIISDAFFFDDNVTGYYPSANATWTEKMMKDYGGDITWVPYNPNNPFTDVPVGIWYEEPIMWALENGVTAGASDTSFNPNGECLRAQVVTFLHRAAGSPKPASTKNPFTDVKSSDWYYNPVLWAVEKNITAGVSATEFGALGTCNRAAVVTFLWRAAGCPKPKTTKNPFKDVKPSDWFCDAVLWALENEITAGISATEFGPTAACNRAQVVTFLYRANT